MKETVKKKFEFLTKDTRSFKSRFFISLAIHFFAVLSFALYPAIEVYLNNSADFDFTLGSMLLVMGIASLFTLVIGIVLSMILKGRLFNYYVTTVFSFALCSFLQGTFLNSSLPPLDGSTVQWHLLTGTAFLNTIVWIICFSIPYIIHFFSKEFWKKAVVYVACLCIVMNAVSLVSLVLSADLSKNESEGFYSRENLYKVSDKGDVVVFILDFFDNKYMNSLLSENPDILSEWTGFTRFTDCTGMYKQTRPTIDYLLTGEKWKYEMPLADFAAKAYSSSDFLERIKNQGYEVNLYVSGFALADKAYGIADNYNSGNTIINPLGMVSSMANYMFYRNMPIISKSVFWHYTDDITNASIKTDNIPLSHTTYTIDDTQFFADFKENGLEKSNKPSFKLIHTMGAHYPYTMNEVGEKSTTASATSQQKGSIHIVSNYLKEMKANGSYENSTIIIMADHGEVEVAEKMTRASMPIVFIKKAGADSSKPFTSSAAPISQDDFHPTILWAVGDKNYSDYGKTFFEIKENEKRERQFLYLAMEGERYDRVILEYVINGNGNDFSNWKLSGNKWHAK